MRIGFDAKKAQRNLTGIGNYSRRVINAIFQFEKDDDLVLYGPQKSVDAAESQLPPVERKRRGFCYEWWRCGAVVRQFKRDKIDIYHGLSNELPFGIGRSKVKGIVTIHDLIFRLYPETYSWSARWILNLKTRYACRKADHIVAVSECTKNDLIRLYDVPPEKISVVYQSIGNQYRNTNTLESLLDYRYVLCVGTIETRKNQLTLVKALKEIDESIHLVLVGHSTPYQKLVEQEAERLGVKSRLHILNHIKDNALVQLYAHAEAMLYMSKYEGFGIPVAEAVSIGVPVIAADSSCLQEAGGPGCIYLEPEDFHGVANAVKSVLEDAELRKNMIEQGRQYSLRFTDEQMAKDLQSVYDKVAKKKTLLIRLSALGDVAMSLGAVADYVENHPEREFVFLTQAFCELLVKYCSANIRIIGVNRQEYRGVKGTFRLLKLVKNLNPDEIADLHNVLRTWMIDLSMLLRGKKVVMIPKHRKERRAVLSGKRRAVPFTSRYVATLQRLDNSVAGSCIIYKKDTVTREILGRYQGDTTEKKTSIRKVGIAPFARYVNKTYPLEKMKEVIALLLANGVEVHLFGARGAEQKILESIAENNSGVVSHAGRHSLDEELTLMREMSVMVTMDSANMHLASLVGTPVVSIWGSTTPACGFMGWGQQEEDAIVADLNCQPCTIAGGKKCPRGSLECLYSISPETVVNQILKHI